MQQCLGYEYGDNHQHYPQQHAHSVLGNQLPKQPRRRQSGTGAYGGDDTTATTHATTNVPTSAETSPDCSSSSSLDESDKNRPNASLSVHNLLHVEASSTLVVDPPDSILTLESVCHRVDDNGDDASDDSFASALLPPENTNTSSELFLP